MDRTRLTTAFEPEDLDFLRELRGRAIGAGEDVHFPDVLHAALKVARRHVDDVYVALVHREVPVRA